MNNSKVRRLFVEKKPGFDIEARSLRYDLEHNLRIEGLKNVRIVNRYDIEGLSGAEYELARYTVFAEPPVDRLDEETMVIAPGSRVLAMEYLPGQYDQRADSAAQCVQILTQKERPEIRCAKLIVLEGSISDADFQRVKNYCINPVESHEASLDKPASLFTEIHVPENVKVLEGFTVMSAPQLANLWQEMGLAMSLEDLSFCQNYFKSREQRDPTITEIRVIDTYWSDHCRHTTFLTRIDEVEVEPGPYAAIFQAAYDNYLASRKAVYRERDQERDKNICLMDLATMAMKELKRQGKLADLDESEEINACSIVVNVGVDGSDEEWLVMFKNETHNHPTEIEPFGGAATCLGGAIRDPLSGRSYVYQAMRVTGCGDPRTSIEDTLPGKLPQRKITAGAAAGYSSYGNQIGLATGQVAEVYHPGYIAKRMEIGAVIGAAPKDNVVRENPVPGDVVVLLGGRTGRDGCGGATGSSKEHTEESLLVCGAEVQKGNPPTERKIQRLFRNPAVSRMIKKCNDFGAGGVAVAIGELADGLDIDLDAVPKKYEGLDGTELAISESQERMAAMVGPGQVNAFIDASREENLEATPVAVVTGANRLKMSWRGQTIVDISREFLNTNGVLQTTNIQVSSPAAAQNFFTSPGVSSPGLDTLADETGLAGQWYKNLQDLNVCSQKGLVERFDSTIGAGSVLMPFGGKTQLTPAEGMAAKIPVARGVTATGTIMSYGFNPYLAKWSPFHGALYAIIEAVAKVVAMGGDYRTVRLTLQEYFEKLGKEPAKWGKPFSALLGAYYAQMKLGIPAIGGKDSMSGTFKDLNVPPTLVAFAVTVANMAQVVSNEFKAAGNPVVLIPLGRDENDLPDFSQLERNYDRIHQLMGLGKILAAQSVRNGGLAAAVSRMSFGNKIGVAFGGEMNSTQLFTPDYGSLILEVPKDEDINVLFQGISYRLLGFTQAAFNIIINNTVIDLEQALTKWQEPLEPIFPAKVAVTTSAAPKIHEYPNRSLLKPKTAVAKPRIFMPVFPGTNCEYDTARAFEKAGGLVDTMVIRNLSPWEIEASIEMMARKIDNSQIVMLPGGFSGGDEPDGSGKFIATAFRNPVVKEAVMRLLKQRDGLVLGICNGFQALIKLGLVPYGEIREIGPNDPTLTFNTIGRHVSCLVRTRVASIRSPWLTKASVGDIHTIAVSHGEGRFVADETALGMMIQNGQIATQYVDLDGNPTYDSAFNPNGSVEAIEGITSPDGRVFGKMGHSERIGMNVAKNVPGEKDQRIFAAGVEYFR
jgi:phosphoribosylformylglycinamidine synthase